MTRAAVTTRTGITIGCAYLPPPPRPSADAERIQAGLLARSHVPRVHGAMQPPRPRLGPLLRLVRALWRWLCAPSPWSHP